MKRILTLLLATLSLNVLSEDFLSGGTYVMSAPDGIKYNLIGQVSTETDNLIVGRTYSSDTESIEITTASSQTVLLKLSNEILVELQPDSKFSVDGFNQMVKNDDAEPMVVVYTDYIANLNLLEGDAYISSPTYDSANTMNVLQTPLANLELSGGKYLVKSSQKFVICYVIDGSVKVFNPKTNKKETVEDGQMAFIVPFPGETGVMVTSKTIEPGELLGQTNKVKEIEKNKDSVIFAVINKKIVGIKVK